MTTTSEGAAPAEAEEQPTAPSPAVDATLAALHLTNKATAAYGRDDLTARLNMAKRRLDDPAFRVLVVGEFKQGKSSLVNALLNAPVCPVDDDIATSAPTAVQYAEQLGARVLYSPPDDDPDAEPEAVDVPVDRVREYVTEATNPANERRVQWVEIGVPRKLLADGLVLVDTPGVGGLGSVHGAITAAALPMADGVLFLSDASQEFSEPEMTFLKQALSLCPNVCCVLTKTDFYPAWRKILDLDKGHLADAKLDLEILPVSSVLRQQALETDDRELNTESGFPALLQSLRTEIVGDGERRGVQAVCSEILAVVDQLETGFRNEEKALGTPESAAELQLELDRARGKSEKLKSQTARWAQLLNDGVGDLSSDVDHDLRGRFREIIREADEVIDEGDPAEFWDEFEPWLYRRTAEDVVYSYRVLQGRAEELSGQVAELFALDQEEIAYRPELAEGGAALRRANATASAEFKVMTKGQRMMTGFRGGYIGVLMFGALGSMIGLAVGALPVAAGLLMGRKSLRDEQERQLTIRRTTAKNATRKYLDEAQFLAGKEQRDTLRRVQRQLRDYYNTRAEELHRSVAESAGAAAQALKADEATRSTRLKDVQSELQRVLGLRKMAIEARGMATEESADA
jgi:hypothetical protein